MGQERREVEELKLSVAATHSCCFCGGILTCQGVQDEGTGRFRRKASEGRGQLTKQSERTEKWLGCGRRSGIQRWYRPGGLGTATSHSVVKEREMGGGIIKM